MITSLARQSVILKSGIKKSVMLGNYEFYYGAGLMAKLLGMQIDESDAKDPGALWKKINTAVNGYKSDDERAEYLAKMLSGYKVSDQYDEQMHELFEQGYNEKAMWQVNI